MAIAIGFLIALPAGVYSAIRQVTAVDYMPRIILVMRIAGGIGGSRVIGSAVVPIREYGS